MAPQGKAEPISNGGGSSVITQLRKCKKHYRVAGKERSEKNVRENQDTKVSEEGGRGGTQGIGAEVPLQPVEGPMVKQASPCSPMEDHIEEDIHTAVLEGAHTAGYDLKEAADCRQSLQ